MPFEYSVDEAVRIMVEYMYLKIQQQDWHAVADAANDVRVLTTK